MKMCFLPDLHLTVKGESSNGMFKTAVIRNTAIEYIKMDDVDRNVETYRDLNGRYFLSYSLHASVN